MSERVLIEVGHASIWASDHGPVPGVDIEVDYELSYDLDEDGATFLGREVAALVLRVHDYTAPRQTSRVRIPLSHAHALGLALQAAAPRAAQLFPTTGTLLDNHHQDEEKAGGDLAGEPHTATGSEVAS